MKKSQWIVLASAFAAVACASARASELKIERFNPPGLGNPAGYVQVVTIQGDAKIVSLGGKAGLHPDGTFPKTLAEQSKLMFEKIRVALEAAGATPADVVDIEVFIVDLANIDPNPVYQDIRNFFPAGHKPTSMVIGVSALAIPGLLVEMKVTAAIASRPKKKL
jgi:2-iminobutanoate/2-iminopropanoate deaminase